MEFLNRAPQPSTPILFRTAVQYSTVVSLLRRNPATLLSVDMMFRALAPEIKSTPKKQRLTIEGSGDRLSAGAVLIPGDSSMPRSRAPIMEQARMLPVEPNSVTMPRSEGFVTRTWSRSIAPPP